MSTHLKQRLVFGGIAILAVFFSISYSYDPIFKYIFVLLNAGFISLALWEYYQLAQHKKDAPLIALGTCTSVAYVISTFLGQVYPDLHFLPPLVLFIALVTAFLSFFKQQANPLTNLAITIFGLAYLTVPLSFGLKINYFNFQSTTEDGRLWLIYVLLVTKMTDMAAYAFGKLFGKTKLAPHISPKKTIEGAVGGLIASVIASILFYLYLHTSPAEFAVRMTLWQSIWFGVCISLFAQFGDLAESVLKRDAGVKDSSYLPGFGGILDMVDSVVFTLPFMYFILKMKLLS